MVARLAENDIPPRPGCILQVVAVARDSISSHAERTQAVAQFARHSEDQDWDAGF